MAITFFSIENSQQEFFIFFTILTLKKVFFFKKQLACALFGKN